MIELETKNLNVKETSINNFEIINKWENDEELIFFSEEDAFKPQSLEETKEILGKILQKKDILHLTIFRKISKQPIGYCVLACIDKFHQRAKIGITIGNKGEWGKSYGEEALIGILNYAFDELGLNRITSEVYSFNVRAIKLFEKLGFRHEGRIRENVRKKDVFSDEIVLGLLKREWVSIR